MIWKTLLEELKAKLSHPDFHAWIKPLVAEEQADGSLNVLVADAFSRDMVQARLWGEIQAAADRHGFKHPLRLLLNPRPPPQQTLPLKVSASPPAATAPKTALPPSNIPPEYTFDTYVVGSNSQLVAAAARAVAESPGTAYNPLFIYGGVGLGKTHLLWAIGNLVAQTHPEKHVVYRSCEQFMNDLVAALNANKMNQFREQFRDGCDVLLLDDVQFLAGKGGTQRELFHTFNALHEAKKQIVLAADRIPAEIAELEGRLKSRFEWGLMADVSAPDFETRLAILQKKSALEKITLPGEILNWLAENVTGNVRELEGALVRLVAEAALSRKTISVELAQKILRAIHGAKKNLEKISPAQFIARVAALHGVTPAEITSAKRHASLNAARQIAMFLCRKAGNFSLPEIGRAFGNRNHSTVLSSIRRVEAQMQENAGFKREIENYLGELGK